MTRIAEPKLVSAYPAIRDPDRSAARIIGPEDPPIGESIRELFAARELFLTLVRREIQVRYKQATLGLLWVVLQPLLPAVLVAAIFGTLVARPSPGTPYFVFALAGFTIWGLISASLTRAAGSMLSDSSLITKVYFPRLVLPLAAGSAVIFDFLVGLALTVAAVAIWGDGLSLRLLAVPVIVAGALVFTLGVGAGLAGLGALYRDFHHILPFSLQLLLYASAIFYPLDLIPVQFRAAFALNPVVGIVESFRWAVLGVGAFPTYEVLVAVIGAGVLAILGLLVFRRVERQLADVI